MSRYTYDVESVDLTDEECSSYAHLVQYLCYLSAQHDLSAALSAVHRAVSDKNADAIQRCARKMWRTEARL